MTSSAPPIVRDDPPSQHLSRLSFGIALGITLLIFFLLHPPWKPIDASHMDANIFWSYVPIPFLVALLLALEHKWSRKVFALETLRLTLVKFAITFLFMNLLWAFVAPPAVAAPVAELAPPAGAPVASVPETAYAQLDASSAPPSGTAAPTPIDPTSTGRLAGFVLGDDGLPRAGALVAVTAGLRDLVFAERPGVELSCSGAGPVPRTLVVGPSDRLLLRGAPDQLHTVRAVDEDGRALFNVPLVPGSQRELKLDRAFGRVTVSCAVHGAAEPPAELAVVGSPFATWTDASGRFELPGVPAGDLELSAWGPAHRRATLRVLLQPGGASDELSLRLR
jgi:hypothetical protein